MGVAAIATVVVSMMQIVSRTVGRVAVQPRLRRLYPAARTTADHHPSRGRFDRCA